MGGESMTAELVAFLPEHGKTIVQDLAEPASAQQVQDFLENMGEKGITILVEGEAVCCGGFFEVPTESATSVWEVRMMWRKHVCHLRSVLARTMDILNAFPSGLIVAVVSDSMLGCRKMVRKLGFQAVGRHLGKTTFVRVAGPLEVK
jgi:hypothetical protein